MDDHGYPELHLGITMGDFAPFYILDVCWHILCRSVLNRRLSVVDDVYVHHVILLWDLRCPSPETPVLWLDSGVDTVLGI